MTISSAVRTAGPYTGNGVTTIFPFAFKVFTVSEVVALQSNGTVETTLVLGSDYTVVLNADQNATPGGTITTLGSPLTSLLTLTLTSSVTELQGTSLTNQGGFFPKVIENALDRAIILIQQLRSTSARSLRFPLSDTGVNTELPVRGSRANNLLAFDSNGDPVTVAPASGSATALQILLATSVGASLVGAIKSFVGSIFTSQAEINNRKAHVMDFLTAAQRLEAISGAVTLDMSANVQAALNSGATEIDIGRFTYLATGLTVPIGVRSITGSGTIKCATNTTILMQWLADTSRVSARYFGGGIKLDVNGKTGCTGLMVGSVTNNPSAGAQEAILYFAMRDALITGFDTNLDSRVSMEHSFDNVVLKSGIVGMKLYGDVVNGGCNANSFRGLRLQGNQVGGIIRNMSAGYSIPLHNNNFDGLILQSNSVCGLAFIGAVGQSINTVHTESNGTGAASVTIDGEVIPKSDIYAKSSQFSIANTDLASSLNPCINLVDSHLTSKGLTGFGSNSASKILCDATSTYHEVGAVSGIGVSNGHASYGQLVSIPGLAFMYGAPLVNITRGANLYPGNPMNPDVSNVAGITSAQFKKSEFGLTPEATFAASVGSTGSNRWYLNLMTCVANKYNISTLLLWSSTTTTYTLSWFAGASQLPQTITLQAGVWTRVVFLSFNKTDHQLYIFPTTNSAPSLRVQAIQCASTDLATVASIYASGTVNVSTLRYNSNPAAPTTGTWVQGDVVYNSAPAPGGFAEFECTTGGTPGTWKTANPISP